MTSIAPEKILKELAALWSTLASPDSGDKSGSGVLRACAMTFIVALEPGDSPQEIGQTIAELIHDHPSRAIMLIPGSETAPLDGRVSAQCWMPFGKNQQVCCEQIEITAPLGDAVQASRLILGLLAPDLPVVIWCRGPAWLESRGFDDLLPRATKVIIDTARRCSIAEVAYLKTRARHAADLAWTRTTATRQAISRYFDDPQNAEQIKDINSIVAPRGERYVAAWLLRALPGRRLSFEGPAGSVRLEGPGVSLDFPILPAPESDCVLLGEELGILGEDPVFDAVFPVAESLS